MSLRSIVVGRLFALRPWSPLSGVARVKVVYAAWAGRLQCRFLTPPKSLFRGPDGMTVIARTRIIPEMTSVNADRPIAAVLSTLQK